MKRAAKLPPRTATSSARRRRGRRRTSTALPRSACRAPARPPCAHLLLGRRGGGQPQHVDCVMPEDDRVEGCRGRTATLTSHVLRPYSVDHDPARRSLLAPIRGHGPSGRPSWIRGHDHGTTRRHDCTPSGWRLGIVRGMALQEAIARRLRLPVEDRPGWRLSRLKCRHPHGRAAPTCARTKYYGDPGAR